MPITLTAEQARFIEYAKQGHCVLVDACIGSGKTTAIQTACDVLPDDKNILYLTYNRRLLLEARSKIRNPNVDVHTFHSFAGTCLAGYGIACDSVKDAPEKFCEHVQAMKIYDVVVVDEYQDLEKNLADMLEHIGYVTYNMRPGFMPQFLIVGDVDQKIYDYTRFDARRYVEGLLRRVDKDYRTVDFTTCFRLPAGYAAEIGQAWRKSIVGANASCRVETVKSLDKIVDLLSRYDAKDVLVLGANKGSRTEILNRLEHLHPAKFNRETVYSSIQDADADTANIDTSQAAIFTTYDSSKGLERPVCVVCDYTPGYLDSRLKYSTNRKILKNLFLVAASRGKNRIIFYVPSRGSRLAFESVGKVDGPTPIDMRPEPISTAFDYKLHEDVDACEALVEVETLSGPSGDVIPAKTRIGMMDISMLSGIYAQAVFFRKFDIDALVASAMAAMLKGDTSIDLPRYQKSWPLWRKVCYLCALETLQERYFYQVDQEYMDVTATGMLKDRLGTLFTGDEDVEVPGAIYLRANAMNGRPMGQKALNGRADVMTDELFELKFVNDVRTEHVLQTAAYVVAFGKPYGKLWNLRTGEMLKVEVPDRAAFLKALCKCVSRSMLVSTSAYLPVTGRYVDTKGI